MVSTCPHHVHQASAIDLMVIQLALPFASKDVAPVLYHLRGPGNSEDVFRKPNAANASPSLLEDLRGWAMQLAGKLRNS